MDSSGPVYSTVPTVEMVLTGTISSSVRAVEEGVTGTINIVVFPRWRWSLPA